MKIYPFKSNDGILHAFEIDNLFCGRRKTVRVIKTLKSAKVIRSPKIFLSWFREECFCEFSINGVLFEVEEPYGDNSRYLISHKSTPPSGNELELIAEAFSKF